MKMTTRMIAVVGVVLVTVFATSCSRNDDVDSRSATQGLPNLKVSLVDGGWKLDAKASTPDLGSKPITLEFDADGTVAGQGPCNRFHGKVVYHDDSIAISGVASTMMACEDDAMANEATFHKVFEGTHDAKVSPDAKTLTLKGANDTKLVWTAGASAGKATDK